MHLVLIEKLAQPGEYRAIVYGKTGGQDSVCVSDPCKMTSPEHILTLVYRWGWSAMVDASKYFHMFPTKKLEHKFLGILHPKSGKLYVYDRFPMGKRNSPGAVGRFGAAFILLVVDSSSILGDISMDNSIQSYVTVKYQSCQNAYKLVLMDLLLYYFGIMFIISSSTSPLTVTARSPQHNNGCHC